MKKHFPVIAIITVLISAMVICYSIPAIAGSRWQSPKPVKSKRRSRTIKKEQSKTLTTVTSCPAVTPGPIPYPMYGVTIESIEDDLDNLTPIIDSLKGLHYKPTVRLVFNKWKESDEKKGEDTNAYNAAASAIRGCSYIMGELLDSFSLRKCDANCYEARAQRYVAGLGHNVDIWEVGNEVNGDWARRRKDSKNPKVINEDSLEIGEKIRRAFKVAKNAGKETALTLYYNDDRKGRSCWEREQDKMLDWARNYVPSELKKEGGLNYVLISYYDDKGHCRDKKTGELLQPDWQSDFRELAKEFPHAKVGFGERGTKCQNGESREECLARKSAYVNSVYSVPVDHPAYVGGVFWWYFKEDMVPSTTKLWSVLNDVIKSGQKPHN